MFNNPHHITAVPQLQTPPAPGCVRPWIAGTVQEVKLSLGKESADYSQTAQLLQLTRVGRGYSNSLV